MLSEQGLKDVRDMLAADGYDLAAEEAHTPLGVMNGALGVSNPTLDESHGSQLQSNTALAASLATRADLQSP